MAARPEPVRPGAAVPLPEHVDDELEILGALLPLDGLDIVELGCGAAQLARALLARHPGSRVTGLEVDARQHAKNLATPQPGLRFELGGAEAVPLTDASFDLALMLKSLHHVPLPMMGRAFAEIGRVLRPAYADHRLDEAKVAEVRTAFEPHIGADGARFVRPMHVRLLRLRAPAG